MELILGAVFFGLASYVGILFAGTMAVQRFDDGPAPGEPPIPWIIAAAAVIGAFIAARSGQPSHIIVSAIVVCALSGIWCTDVRYGIVPDAFTIVPLALVLGLSLVQRDPWPLVSSAVAFIPFAGLAVASKGRGMGWGDVKLAALGGAVLGFETALLAFAAGAVTAALYAYARGRQREVIAFAPYLAGAIAVALPLVSG